MYNMNVCLQYCEFGPDPAKCYEWMKANLPYHYARLVEGKDHLTSHHSVAELDL